LVDTGYPPGAMPLAEMRRLLPSPVHEIFRIEMCAQALLLKALPFGEFLESFAQELRTTARRAVALKSIIAYRSGLAIREWEPEEAARAYLALVSRVRAGGSPRLTEKPLLDTLALLALEVAGETGCPLQLHAGFGDPDIDLLLANPLLLRPLLENPRWAHSRLVLLHMAYPYVREAAFMAAVWPQVYLDLSLALPFLGPGALLPLIEILSLAPASKLAYGSDLGGLPELFALSADWGRGVLGEALGWLVDRGGLTAEQARAAARQILSETAVTLYRLPALL
ncbi:MAG: amidohydrolase family protein, partial [Candidatus Rokubacteria bacterium]|nr:amidohydrolase family protein [Candidatus Rokubacteria bacterium]